MGHDILDLAALEIADVEAEVRQRHTEVAVDLFKILFVLMRRPAGPCALAAPCKAADQAGRLILVRQGHHDLALTDALAMDLMDVADRLGEVEAAEERMTDTLIHCTGDVEDAVLQRGNSHAVAAWDIKGVKLLHRLVQHGMTGELRGALNEHGMHLKLAGGERIALTLGQV